MSTVFEELWKETDYVVWEKEIPIKREQYKLTKEQQQLPRRYHLSPSVREMAWKLYQRDGTELYPRYVMRLYGYNI